MASLEKIKTISIYGMGLMGTSLAYALRQSENFEGIIYGFVKTQKSKDWILQHHLADHIFLSEEKKSESYLLSSDLILIGLPILDSIEFIKYLAEMNFKGLITDMGSTRWELECQIREIEKKKQIRFVGSHPMCGSEESGPQYYIKDLYKNKLCIIIHKLHKNQPPDRNFQDLEFISNFWKELGMEIDYMDSKTHDYILSYLSHAPHIISSILATVIGKQKELIKRNQEAPIPILGGGLRDMIRIAGSNPKMWYDIISTNKENIIVALKEIQKELEKITETIENHFDDWWFEWQNNAKEYRNVIYGISKSDYE